MTDSEQVLSRMTMQQAENMLLPHGFSKAHRSYLVNRSLINKIEKHQLTLDKETVPIGSTFYDALILELSKP